MSLFSLMFVGHLVGDFLLQTSWMADNKRGEWFPLLVHCFIYTVTVALFALPAGGLSVIAIVILFIAHVLFDKSNFVFLWLKYVSRSPDNTWLKIVQDQVWHIVILAVLAFI